MGQRAVLIPQLISFIYEPAAGPYNDRIKQQQDRGKREYYGDHTDQSAPRHQHAEGGNYGDSRTPKVAAKNDIALTNILCIDVLWAIRTASCLLFPLLLSTWYLLVIRIA